MGPFLRTVSNLVNSAGSRRSTEAAARTHHVEEVLDPTYKPKRGSEEEALFKEKLHYMYTIFTHCLKTDMGKSIVREHDKDFDAQKVWEKVLAYQSKSTYVSHEAHNLLSYITSTKLYEHWNNTSLKFILTFSSFVHPATVR